jgi:two-component sensor histidine kinase
MTLRHRLSLLVAIALIPPLLLTLYNVVRSQVVLDKQARAEVAAAARLISAELAQLIDGSRHLMAAMSRHPAVPDDEAACAAYFKSVIGEIPVYRAAAIIDSDGGFHCSTSPTPPKLAATDRDHFLGPSSTGALTTGALVHDPATERPSIHVSMPYRSANGSLNGAILLALDPQRMAEDLEGRPERPPYRAFVLDRDGSLVLSIPQDNAASAKAIAQDIFPRLASASSGVIDATGLEGRPEIVGFVSVPNSPRGLFVAVATEREAALAEAKTVNAHTFVFASTVMMLAIAATWLATHFLIDRPIRAIVATARRREAGDLKAPFPASLSSTEFGQLSTALSRMSGKIHELLEQKGLLFRELQHRVMNSLTLLSTVLDLQRRQIRDPAAQEHLAHARDRVVSMGTIYRYLYQTDTADNVEFGGFLKIICEQSQNAYAGAHKPTIAVTADRLELSGSNAIALAMLTHELITNALKHAYPEGEAGPINVTLTRGRDGSVELRVADQGRGLPADFQIGQSSSLGMKVIASTAAQLGGTLDINRLEPGTEFVIRLPADIHKQR